MSETAREAVTRWLAEPDTWVGVFENHDLGHPNVGHCFAIPFRLSDGSFEQAEIGKTRAPDTSLYIGWRYILIAKCKTVDEVMQRISEEGAVRAFKGVAP